MIEYNPTESAQRFHQSTAKVKALWGPVGSGKSSAALWEFILMCLESTTPVLGVVVRSSYRELMDTTKITFEQWFGAVSEWHGGNEEFKVCLPHPISRKPLIHTLKFRAIQRPEETQKLQSMEPAFIFLEECVPSFATTGIMGAGISEAIFNVAYMRLRQRGAMYWRLVCTANPPSKTHWYYQKFIDAENAKSHPERKVLSIFQPPFENKKNLPPNYYEDMRNILDPDLYRRYVEGEVITAWDGERVFPEARDGYHITDKPMRPIKNASLVLGFDYGLTPATLISQITPTGQWIWLRELQSFNSSFETHVEVLRSLMHEYYPGMDYRSWGDPAGIQKAQTDAKTCVEIAAAKGYLIRAGAIDWQSRKEAIKQRLTRLDSLGQPGLLISRDGCPHACEAITGGYRYPKHADGTIGVRPIKNDFSHIMDAAQYIATREFDIMPARQRVGEPIIYERPGWPPIDPFTSYVKRRSTRGSWMTR